MPHLLVDISAHGFGHIAQTAPVVNELARCIPDLRITLRSAAPTAFLKQRFQCDFQHIHVALDFGMAMFNAVEVDVPRSLAAYREYHTDWDARVALAAEEMRAIQPDLLLANVPYLSLAAAHAAKIPAVGMCCLNWADIYRHYAPDDAESRAIHAQMLAAYNSAQVFLKLRPTMPMPGLHNVVEIAPIAQLGKSRAKVFPPLPPGEGWGGGNAQKLVLIAMGGIDYRLPMENWPHIPGVRWLIPQAWNIQRDDMIALESLGMNFSDVLASVDAVLTKPGYGTFAEAACAGVPVLYVPRDDWPEQPYLVDWLQQNGVCREVTNEQLRRGNLWAELEQLWEQLKPKVPSARGAAEAATMLSRYF
ncbi:MAG: hypothetical protein Q7S71_03490 [Candidatus Nitrotoga sp.]|nr:hypothetical protein [Candidatus Nitrotoga sp.]